MGIIRGIYPVYKPYWVDIGHIAILRDTDPWPGGWIPCPSRWERVGVANMPSNTPYNGHIHREYSEYGLLGPLYRPNPVYPWIWVLSHP